MEDVGGTVSDGWLEQAPIPITATKRRSINRGAFFNVMICLPYGPQAGLKIKKHPGKVSLYRDID